VFFGSWDILKMLFYALLSMVSLQHFRNYQLPILKILDILIQKKLSPKSQQTIIQQHPVNPENPDSDKIISKISTNNH